MALAEAERDTVTAALTEGEALLDHCPERVASIVRVSVGKDGKGVALEATDALKDAQSEALSEPPGLRVGLAEPVVE